MRGCQGGSDRAAGAAELHTRQVALNCGYYSLLCFRVKIMFRWFCHFNTDVDARFILFTTKIYTYVSDFFFFSEEGLGEKLRRRSLSTADYRGSEF